MSESLPPAIDVARVGSYPVLSHSGGGFFFDDVLEYRVGVHPPEGGDDRYQTFPTYQQAVAFAASELGADEPVVLVRQREWVVEQSPGHYVRKTGERLTEWRVEWLKDRKRLPGAIEQFLAQRVH
jgi:putative acetyltransferase